MADARPTARVVRLGDFEVDLAAGHLRRRGSRVRLRDQAFKVLEQLLERPGEVVTREELRRRLWPDDVFVEFENNLNTTIARLRAALGDSAEHPRFIETLPRRGYRLTILPEMVRPTGAQSPARRARVLVLPLLNLTGEPAQEYFSDAMSDAIITELAVLAPERLGVIARTTAMRYKGRRTSLASAARELRLDFVVEGAVARDGDRVVLNVQVIEAGNETHVFARRYTATPHEIFELQRTVARDVAASLGAAPAASDAMTGDGTPMPAQPPARPAPTQDPEAYRLYLQGRHELHRLVPHNFPVARRLLEQAIARDPGFALAYDALAELYWSSGFVGLAPPREAFTAGTWAAVRALEIDNTLAETHALLGMFRKELDYDWAEVEREMAFALALNPRSPIVRLRRALSGLMPHGRLPEAISEVEAVLEDDPQWEFALLWLSILFDLARRFDRGLEIARGVIALAPESMFGHIAAGHLYRDMSMHDQAVEAFRAAAELSAQSPMTLGCLGMSLAQSGRPSEARGLLEALCRASESVYVPPTSIGWIHLGLGEVEEAIDWMDRAIEARDPMIVPIRTYPFLDPVRGHPRFASLLTKMNL